MKESWKYFNDLVFCEEIERTVIPNIPCEKQVMEKHSSEESLLSIIHTRDACNLPTGDLQYFVSPKSNPEVKKFILDNLMMDVSGSAAPKNPDIDDDTAFALMRQDNESVESYMKRVNDFGRSQSDIVYSAVKDYASAQ